MTQWLGLQGAFPEPQTALQPRSHLPSRDTGPLLTTVSYSLFSAPCPPARHSLPLCSLRVAKGSQRIWLVPTLASLAPILPAHLHLSHWDQAPQTLAHSTHTAVSLLSVPRNGAAWRSGHWAKNFPIPGLEGTLPASQLASQQMPEDLLGPPHPCWMAPWTAPRTRASLFRKICSLAECQHWLEKWRALLRPTSHLTNEETEAQRGDVICPKSHSAKGGLEAGRLAPVPPVPPLTASPFTPQGVGRSRPLQPTLTSSCCKAAAYPEPLDLGELKPR